jgi:hypothetical protein
MSHVHLQQIPGQAGSGTLSSDDFVYRLSNQDPNLLYEHDQTFKRTKRNDAMSHQSMAIGKQCYIQGHLT